MNSVVAAIASGVTSLAGNVIQNYSQDLRDAQARKWQEDMWNKANAYNHPAAVMARMKQAGLNPNLLAGQPVQGSASVPSASQGSKSASFDDIAPNTINAYLQAKQTESTINLEQEQASLLHEQAREKKEENDARERLTEPSGLVIVHPDGTTEESYEDKKVDYYGEMARITLDNARTGNDILNTQAAMARVEKVMKDNDLKLSNERVKNVVEIATEELRKLRSGNANIEASTNVLNQQAMALWDEVLEGLVASSRMNFDDDGNVTGVNQEYLQYSRAMGIISEILSGLGSVGQMLFPFVNMAFANKMKGIH